MKTIHLAPGIDTGLARRVERFWAKVRKTDGCWLWTASTNGRPGYGIFRGGVGRDKYGSSRWALAHRFAYELAHGPIPAGMEIDHRCRTRLCVNPAHMELVPHRTNTLRSTGPSAMAARRDGCSKGHPYTPENLRLSGGKRRCITCDRAKEARRYIRRYGREPKPQKNPRRPRA